MLQGHICTTTQKHKLTQTLVYLCIRSIASNIGSVQNQLEWVLVWKGLVFSIFRFFCTLRFQIFKYCPNHTSMEILFIQLSDDARISISQNWPLLLVLCSRVSYGLIMSPNIIKLGQNLAFCSRQWFWFWICLWFLSTHNTAELFSERQRNKAKETTFSSFTTWWRQAQSENQFHQDLKSMH